MPVGYGLHATVEVAVTERAFVPLPCWLHCGCINLGTFVRTGLTVSQSKGLIAWFFVF